MALTVGELNAIVSVDDRAVPPALRRTEQAMRQAGQQMGQDADRSGQQAGQLLGGGLIRGADGQWRNLRGELADAVTAAAAEAEAQARSAGRRAGGQFGDGMGTGARQGGDELATAVRRGGDDAEAEAERAGAQSGEGFMSRLGSSASGGMGELGGSLKEELIGGFGPAAAGALIGATLIEGIGSAMEQGQITGRLGAQLGATPAEAQRYGHIAGQMYADAVTEDFQGAADAISMIMRAGIMPTGATDAQIKRIATGVSDLSSTFELDLGQTANAVGQILKTKLARDGGEALDVLTRGMQTMGPRADDLMDTFNEYSVIFQRLGLSAKTATGLMSQGMKAGARDTDVIADALKEFTIEGVQGSDKIVGGFKAIGLNSDRMVKMIAKGGPSATKALQMTLDKLRAMEDPVKRDAAATELFGTKSEDTQKALLALDPSKAVNAFGQVGGAVDKMGNSLRDNAGTKLEQAKRSLQQGLVTMVGGGLVELGRFKGFLGHLWDDAGKGGAEGADRVVAFAKLVGQRLLDKGKELAPKIVEMLSNAGTSAAEYIAANPMAVLKIGAIAGAIVVGILALPGLVAAALAGAAVVMVGSFVNQLVTSANAQLERWWGTFSAWAAAKAAAAPGVMNGLGSSIGGWFSGLWSRYVSGPVSRTWNSFIGSVNRLPGRASGALSGLGNSLAGSASRGWSRFQSASVAKGAQFLGWVRGLPGRTSAAVGSMGGLLVQKGRNVVQGLWNGIAGMGGWLRGRIMGWARSVIPGPIAKALGIHSPSKVTTAQGRWIARGLIEGLTGSTKQVKAAATRLADIVADSMRRGSRRSGALKRISADSKKLLKLASQRERVATRLKSAQKKLADLTSSRDKLAADVKKGVLDSANITSQGNDGLPVTATSILDNLKQDRLAAQKFAASLASLRKKGVRADLIAQIAQAGVEQGSSAAAALANANSNQIKQINAEQAKLVGAAGNAGTVAGNAMYGAGIDSARGLIRGLQSQQAAIDKQMLKIAQSMSKAIRKALGIKSPSRVMALVGQYTAQGLIRGVEGQRSAVNRSMASLVETPAPGSWDMASARARARAAEKVVIEFRSDQQGEAAYLMGKMRRGIQKTAGGDVQFALSGRRSG
ncbi:phage tail tape measure protein [Streptomyces griseoluteus]|uniref:phage tail tape measure protein n=1 Tax=Streptomyces griseoluteus TaxID=29306 RepID=UPI0033DA0A1D